MDMWTYYDEAYKMINEVPPEKECCPNKYISIIEGFYVCINCGIVNKGLIFDDNKFGLENGKDNIYLRGTPSNLYSNKLGSVISGNSKIAQINNWESMTYEDKVLWEVSKDLNLKIGNLSQIIIKDTLQMYKAIYKNTSIYRGNNKKGFIAACLYISSKKNNLNKTPKQICDIMEINITVFNKCLRLYKENTEQNEETSGIINSNMFVDNFCVNIDLSYKIKNLIVSICDAVDSSFILEGTIPQNICIGVILFVCTEINININIRDMCKTYKIGEATLSKILKKIQAEKTMIFEIVKNEKISV